MHPRPFSSGAPNLPYRQILAHLQRLRHGTPGKPACTGPRQRLLRRLQVRQLLLQREQPLQGLRRLLVRLLVQERPLGRRLPGR